MVCGAASGDSEEHRLKQSLQHRQRNLGSVLLAYSLASARSFQLYIPMYQSSSKEKR